MQQPIIRPILSGDDAALGNLIKAVLTEFKANKPGTAYFDEATLHLSKVFEDPAAAYWVIEEAGKVIGGGGIFPTTGLPHGTCELVKLYLYPEARGRGLGKAIINRCFERAIELRYTSIYLESLPELSAAVSMYEKLGFEHQCNALGNSGHFGCTIWMVKKDLF
ncbi:MAG: GNAT family N-acetyltransferase [Bacteroidota bacterium]